MGESAEPVRSRSTTCWHSTIRRWIQVKTGYKKSWTN